MEHNIFKKWRDCEGSGPLKGVPYMTPEGLADCITIVIASRLPGLLLKKTNKNYTQIVFFRGLLTC